jgi:hypothetical protein
MKRNLCRIVSVVTVLILLGLIISDASSTTWLVVLGLLFLAGCCELLWLWKVDSGDLSKAEIAAIEKSRRTRSQFSLLAEACLILCVVIAATFVSLYLRFSK